MEKDIYVVVAENDQEIIIAGKKIIDEYGQLVFEQYTKFADLESIKKRAESLSKIYGKCRIAKLQFIE